jgi:hypothetical protein
VKTEKTTDAMKTAINKNNYVGGTELKSDVQNQ